jgi:hypothetical protein
MLKTLSDPKINTSTANVLHSLSSWSLPRQQATKRNLEPSSRIIWQVTTSLSSILRMKIKV